MKFTLHNSTLIIRRLHRYIFFALCIVNCALLSSCNTDELCYEHPHEGDFFVNVDMTNVAANHCEEMRVWVYAADGSNGVPYDLPRNGGKIKLYPGDYMFLAHNNDTEWITFSGKDSYHNHVATTRDCTILEPMNDGMSRADDDDEIHPNPGERVAVAPEPIYGIGTGLVSISEGQSLYFKIEPLYCTYTFEFRDTGSLSDVSKMSAAITGMAESVYLSTGALSTNTVTIPFSVKPGSDNNSIVGSFYTYGHHESVDTPHRMALYLVMKNGKQYKFTKGDNLDVTMQIHNAADKRNVHIIITGIKIPENQGSGNNEDNNETGWDVNLDGWEEENIEIIA